MPRKRKTVAKTMADKGTTRSKRGAKDNKQQKLEKLWLTGDGLQITKLILSVQKSECNFKKSLTEIRKLQTKINHKEFITTILMSTRLFLNREERDFYAARVIKFLGLLIASFGDEEMENNNTHPVILDFFNEITTFTSHLVHIRVRCCSLVACTMNSFSGSAELDQALLDKITNYLLPFTKDISPLVRVEAFLAIQRLQDPDNVGTCPVSKALHYHLESDPNPKVRQTILSIIAKKPLNLPAIFDRMHDADEKVRQHVYLQISSYPVRNLKIADRNRILSAGLYDRSSIVRKTVVNLTISNWIAAYKNNYIEFIRAIKFDSNENEIVSFRKLAEKALEEYFKKIKLAELVPYLNFESNEDFENCVPFENLSLEMLIVWKMIIKHQQHVAANESITLDTLQEVSQEEEAEQLSEAQSNKLNAELFPELSVFCNYFKNFLAEFNFGTDEEIKYQELYFNQSVVLFLEIVQLGDMGDEIGKSHLQNLLENILAEFNLSEYAVQEILRIFEIIMPDVEQRISFFADSVNEVIKTNAPSEYSKFSIIEDLINRSDMDIKVKANNIKMQLMELKEIEANLIQQKRFAEYHNILEEERKLNSELVELLRPIQQQQSFENSSQTSTLSQAFTNKTLSQADIKKNLMICYFVIAGKGVKPGNFNQKVYKIYNDFVRLYLESVDASIRIWALKTATAYSLLYEALSKEIYLMLKSQVFKSSNVLIWQYSIECIVDLLCKYSIEVLDNFPEESSSSMSINQRTNSHRTLYTDAEDEDEQSEENEIKYVKNFEVMQMLSHLLNDSVNKRVFKATVIGFCKLMLHGFYYSRDILSNILILYFNPASESEIVQIIGIFLKNLIDRKKQELLHDAFERTISTLLDAPFDSPLKEIKFDVVLKFMIGAMRPVFCSAGLDLHTSLGRIILEIMKENYENKEMLKVFSKELLSLEIGSDETLKKDMLKQLDFIVNEASLDARTTKHLSDFRKMVQGNYRVSLNFSSSAPIHSQNDEETIENDTEDIESVGPSLITNSTNTSSILND